MLASVVVPASVNMMRTTKYEEPGENAWTKGNGKQDTRKMQDTDKEGIFVTIMVCVLH